jgi:hypothetical protein
MFCHCAFSAVGFGFRFSRNSQRSQLVYTRGSPIYSVDSFYSATRSLDKLNSNFELTNLTLRRCAVVTVVDILFMA